MSKHGPTVWTSTPHGWRRVRAKVPGRPRSGHPSERVPRPPSYRMHAAGVEDLRPSSELEVFGAHVAREVARELVDRLGGVATAVVVGYLLFRRRKRRKE